jgi:hypothetical protein
MNSGIAEPSVLDDAPVPMGFAILLASGCAQEHGHPLFAAPANAQQAKSALQRFFGGYPQAQASHSMTCASRRAKNRRNRERIG